MSTTRNIFRNIFVLIFSLMSFSIFAGLGSCDNAPSVKDSTSTSIGNPVAIHPLNPGKPLPPSNTDNNLPPPQSGNTVNKVILVIGSGMGPQEIGQVIQYRRLRKPSDEKLALEKLMDKKLMGMVATNSYLDIVSDSASATTSMACGLKTRNDTVGLDANGNPCETIVEKASKLGKATGIVSNDALSRAGIAAFLAHHLSSEDENEIAAEVLSGKTLDVLLSGGMEHLLPLNGSGATMKMSEVSECSGIDADLDGPSQRKDQTNLIDQAKSNGYQFVCKRDQLSAVSPNDRTKLLGVFSNSHFPRSPERKGLNSLPSLAEMTTKSLEILEKKPEGFLLIVQGGLTQLAAQENDAGTLLQESLDFDSALGVALEYAEKNPDTLLILTSDHETGGFGFAYSNQPGNKLTLPSGAHYEAPYNYAPYIRYDLLMDQQKSFYALTQELLDGLYGTHPTLDLDTAANDLVSDLNSNTGYQLDSRMAKGILQNVLGIDSAQTRNIAPFYVNDNIHPDLLARALSSQTSTVWASGTSTSTPVMVLATGPAQYAERVRGFIDNTDIAKIIGDALAGQ
jgi:alkaline phosphatase